MIMLMRVLFAVCLQGNTSSMYIYRYTTHTHTHSYVHTRRQGQTEQTANKQNAKLAAAVLVNTS